MWCNLCRTPKQGNRGSKVFYLDATDRQIPLSDEKKRSLKPNKMPLGPSKFKFKRTHVYRHVNLNLFT